MGSLRDRSVVLNPGDVERMGFDFDEFDAGIAEGTSEVEQNPWDLVLDESSGELVRRDQRDGVRGGLPGSVVADAVDADLRVRGSSGLEFEEGVEAVYGRVMRELIAEHGTPLHESDYGDLVWGAIFDWAESRDMTYSRRSGRFLRAGPRRTGRFSDFDAPPGLSSLTGLGGFQSPEVPSGPLGGSSVQLPVSPPSVRRQSLPAGSPGFGVPDDLLRDLVSRMGGEPPRVGRQHPESGQDGRERGGDYKPGAPLSDEQREINRRGLEGARDALRGLGGSIGDMPLEHKLALAAALAGAGLLTVGTGGFAGPALVAGGGLSLLSNQ